MSSINEEFLDRSVHSVRINDHLIECAKKTGIPISNIIEAGLPHFVTLSDEERIKYLVENDPDKVDPSQIQEPRYNYAEKAIEKAKESLGTKSTSKTSNKFLIAVGLVLLYPCS
jgi:hypothetical protein